MIFVDIGFVGGHVWSRWFAIKLEAVRLSQLKANTQWNFSTPNGNVVELLDRVCAQQAVGLYDPVTRMAATFLVLNAILQQLISDRACTPVARSLMAQVLVQTGFCPFTRFVYVQETSRFFLRSDFLVL